MRLSVAVVAVSFSIVSLALADDVRASITRKSTNIPAQSLGSALQALAKDRNFSVIYVSEEVNNRSTEGAVGDFSRDEALKQLLKGTGMTYRYLDEKTVTVVLVSMGSGGEGSAAPSASSGTATSAASASNQEDPKSWAGLALLAQATVGQATGGNSVEPQTEAAFPNMNEPILQEVIVTAQKREQRLKDVPISIVAVSGDELQRRQITSLDDLPSAVPGFSYVKTGNTVVFQIRGVSNTQGTGPLVGMYIDEADVTLGGASDTQISPITYDVERVEVLRGPQGTLYGEGSAGGMIHFITRNPNLNGVEFNADVAALFTEDGGPSQRINAMVNVPLIANELGLRIATTFEHDGGWIDLVGTDQRQINAQDLTNVRVKGLWKPSDQLTVSAMAIINRNNGAMNYSNTTSPTEWTQVFNLSAAPRLRNDYDLYNLTLTYDLSSVSVLNTTTYLHVSAPIWNNGFIFPASPPGPGAFAFESYVPHAVTTQDVWTDELRLTSTGSGRWQWTIGAFYRQYLDAASTFNEYFGVAGPLPPPGVVPESSTLHNSWSAFCDTSYRLLDRLTFGVGVRYFSEKQDQSTVGSPTQTARFDSVDPRIYALLKLTSDVNVYASAAKGFRSGGFNAIGAPTYAPESVRTYELGTKMAFFQNRFGLDAAIFRSDYINYQTFALVTGGSPFGQTTNAGQARIKGFEASLTWQPVPKWQWGIRGDYLDARFTEVLPSSSYAPGDPLDQVPRYQVTASGQRDFTWVGKPGFIRLDYSQTAPLSLRDRSSGPWYYAESDVIKLLNLRTSLQMSRNLSVGVFAQNLLNDDGFTTPYWFNGAGTRLRPRTYGVDFSVNLE
jgi:outer membrane receptor protein involved in Fe transport